MTMHQVDLSAGSISYQDTGGDGPVVVLLGGLIMDQTLWSGVVAELGTDHRCVVPVLPMGAHPHPMSADADLSPQGLARLVAEFLEALDLTDVTVVGNDTGGALVQLLVADGAPRVGRIVLVSCDAFENFPPGLTGRTVVATGKLPPALFGMFMQQMRIKPVRRMPISFGWLTKRGDATVAGWLKPIYSQAGVRRDAVRVLRGISRNRKVLVEAAEHFPAFDKPALVVWAEKDKVMPPEHGRRLAEVFPQGKLVEVPDSHSLIPLDQPEVLARAIRDFTG